MLSKIIDLYRDREYFKNMTRIALPIIVQQLAFAALGAFVFHLPVYFAYLCAMSKGINNLANQLNGI